MASLNTKFKLKQVKLEESLRIPHKYRLSNYITTSIFDGKPFTLSGFAKPERDQLRKIGLELGLTWIDETVDNCIVVAAGAANPKVKDAKKFKNCVVVNKQYL